MPNVLSYHVMVQRRGLAHWLDDSEHDWTTDFHASAAFNNARLANDIAERETKPTGETFYVMGCLETVSG